MPQPRSQGERDPVNEVEHALVQIRAIMDYFLKLYKYAGH